MSPSGARDIRPDRVVPPAGFTARLTVFAAAVLAFLAVFALAFSMTTGRLADRWSAGLARSATVRISAPEGQMAAQTQAVLEVLRTTPGVADARALDPEEERALLEPWFGPDLPLDSLPIPQLVSVTEAESGFDPDALRLRLQAEAPGAVLDDHARWRQPLIRAADRLRVLGLTSLALIAIATGALIVLAADSALAANLQVIRVLRLVGAYDTYIARAFVRRFTLRTLIGSAIGTVLAGVVVAMLPSAGDGDGFLTGLGFEGVQWLWLLTIPPLAGLVAFVATRVAAFRALRGLR